ncbi:MAG TPA: hypothetical protein VF335_02680 [Chitinivibrionales bacterium]
MIRHILPIVLGVAVFAYTEAATSNVYSDGNRGLFLLPQSSAVATSDFVFSRDGTNQTNPANLAFDSISVVAMSYAGFYQNSFSSSMLSYVTPVSRYSGIGFSLGYLYNPNIMNTENLQTVEINNTTVPVWDSTRVSTFSESQIYFHAAYGFLRPLSSAIEVGAGVGINAQRHSLEPYRGYGLGCDGGVLIHFNRIGLKTGLIGENLTTNYIQWDKNYAETALPHVRFGIGWRKEIPYLYGRIQLQFKSLDLLANEGVNADSTYDSSGVSLNRPITKHLRKDPLYFLLSGTYGLEYSVLQVLSLRLGIPLGDSYGGDGNRIAFGCGVNLMHKKLSLDFSYITHELAGTYQLGVSYRWQTESAGK